MFFANRRQVAVSLIFAFALSLLVAGCSGSGSPAVPTPPSNPGAEIAPVVTAEPSSAPIRVVGSVAPGVDQVQAVNVTFKVDRALVLTQDFFYGADLQYSSQYDSTYDLYNQSMAIGHIPARFRVVGKELQLIADNQRLYPSDVNHPEQLLSRFQIVDQTDSELTLSTASSGVFLAEIFEGTRSGVPGTIANPAGAPPRDSWVRSLDFAPEGNYILQQTSVMLADGVIGEFMESIFPAANLAAGPDFQKFKMDPDQPTGGAGDLARFMLLPGETVRDGEAKFTYAQHFDISGGKTIDWYITPNVPDETLSAIQEAVEGWNRYFRAFKGIERDVVLFKGRLPAPYHLGDPRFNVINWDSRRVAGAAYESQANDPATGVQSHSLIYMPAAWLQIGLDYYKNAQGTDNDASAKMARAGAQASTRLACMRDLQAAGALLASGRLAANEIADFSRELLKQTLFHEVGHSLGLAHDFKGSLSYDRRDPKSMFSTSIMDYNDYEIERAAFDGPHTAAGPLLEYDRQALSFIYNQKKDVAATDAKLPACNDDVADNNDGGVDPLCVRYDIENDPTLSVKTALDRVNLAELPGDVTLAQAIRRQPSLILGEGALKAVKSEDDLGELAARFATAVQGSLNFYFISGKGSLRRTVLTNARALLSFADGVLPASIDERAFREREFTGIQASIALQTLPAEVEKAISDAEAAAMTAFAATPFLAGLDPAKRQAALDDLDGDLDDVIQSFAKNPANGLVKLRSAVLAALNHQDGVEYFIGSLGTPSVASDYETAIIGILSDATINASGAYDDSARIAAVKSLVTYQGRTTADPAIQAAHKAVYAEAAAAKTNDDRDLAEQLVEVLAKASK